MKNRIDVLSDRIIKYFNSEICFMRELLIYQLELAYTPKLLDYSQQRDEGWWISIERIIGHHPQIESLFDFTKMLDTLAYFHRDLKHFRIHFSHHDTSPKNFILTSELCYLIDFSEINVRKTEYDIVSFFLFAVDFLPHEQLASLLDYFIKHFAPFYRINDQIIFNSVVEFDYRRALYNKPNIISEEKQAKRVLIGDRLIS